MIKLTEDSLKVGLSRYFQEGEGWGECSLRAASAMGSQESTPELVGQYTEEFHRIIGDMLFIPAGRILRNSGRQSGSLFNCYHLPIGDSIEQIGQYYKDSLTLWSGGGGVGVNFSSLRPKDDPIHKKGGKSSGALSFLKASDATAGCIESGGSRRAAGLVHMIVSHPEVVDFINAKTVDGEISTYNLTVAITEDFLVAVERDEEWTFKFNHQDYHSMPARKLWDMLMHNAWKNGEPGLFYWDYMKKNNSYYFAPISGTNPCGEASLEDYGVCDLGSLVLPNFVSGQRTNWKKLEETIHLAIRFLDNVIEANKYVLPEVKNNAFNIRRIGLGVMGLAEYLFSKEARYGSHEAVAATEKLMKFIRNVSYEASIELAKEKGAFPKFEPVAYGKASFIRKLPAALRMDIKKHGIRNCTMLAMAPTGTISLMAGCSGGIEPLYSKGYKREDRIGSRVYIHPITKQIVESGGDMPEWFVDAHEVDPKEHLEMQAVVQKYTDGSVSKTINLPNSITQEELSGIMLEYIRDLKGVTVYRDGSRGGQVQNPLTLEEIKEELTKASDVLTEDDVKCAGGSCEI